MDRQRQNELIAMGEEEASRLPREEWYDRVCLLRQRLAYEMMNSIKGRVSVPHDEIKPRRASNEAINLYKNYHRD